MASHKAALPCTGVRRNKISWPVCGRRRQAGRHNRRNAGTLDPDHGARGGVGKQAMTGAVRIA
jgi:hypothetical protein